MNRRFYWSIKKKLTHIVFYIKSFLFKATHLIQKSDASFSSHILKYSIIQTIKSLFLVFVIWIADGFLLKWFPNCTPDESLFMDALIGGIGIAGLILGLYCANIASIYTAKYSDAPEDISKAFQRDRLTQKCIGSLIKVIIYGLIVIAEILLDIQISWIAVFVLVLWMIRVIVTYSLAGNRTYQLSDVFAVADDTYRVVFRIINKDLKKKFWSSDVNFQNHFLQKTIRQLELLKLIQLYGTKSTINDNSPLYEFMCKNLALLSSYWDVKPTIGKKSLWFRNEGKYQKWHSIDSSEASIALRTGTSLRVKSERDYLWFEQSLLSMNMSCFKEIIKRKDYNLIYKYLLNLDELVKNAIKAKEASYYIGVIDEICELIEKEILSNGNIDNEQIIAGIVDAMTLIYLELILKVCEYCKSLNIYSICNKIVLDVDAAESVENTLALRGKRFDEFYQKIILEKRVEGQRITPDWVIKQTAANEEYLYINSLLRCVIDCINTIFSRGKRFADNKHLFEGCIILMRFYEFESKYGNLKTIIGKRIEEIESYHVDKEQKWEKPTLIELDSVVDKWKKEIPSILVSCSTAFTLDKWDHNDDYPDFLGECFNHICEDAVGAIIRNDYSQFKNDYDSLSKLLRLYQDYIITDFANRKESYRKETAFYMFTSPIAEWAQIGGLAILWGEFHSDNKWQCEVKKVASQVIDKNIPFAEKLIEYAQHRTSFIFGITNRGLLENGWNMQVADAIKASGICQTEHCRFGYMLKTESVVLKAFCSGFMNFGFMSDPAEVFWVMCINPLVSKDKRYRTRGSWEDKLNGK